MRLQLSTHFVGGLELIVSRVVKNYVCTFQGSARAGTSRLATETRKSPRHRPGLAATSRSNIRNCNVEWLTPLDEPPPFPPPKEPPPLNLSMMAVSGEFSLSSATLQVCCRLTHKSPSSFLSVMKSSPRLSRLSHAGGARTLWDGSGNAAAGTRRGWREAPLAALISEGDDHEIGWISQQLNTGTRAEQAAGYQNPKAPRHGPRLPATGEQYRK